MQDSLRYTLTVNAPETKDNDFIMFPSHIPHWVDENKTDIPRISLAFNIKIA